VSERSNANFSDAGTAIMELLGNRSKKAHFMTEVVAALRRRNIGIEAIERAVGRLEAQGVLMMRDHFCADPHLAGVDLRIVALVDSRGGGDAQLSAIREIDQAWDKWLASYLVNHRCS
jgi:hypothetical protein